MCDKEHKLSLAIYTKYSKAVCFIVFKAFSCWSSGECQDPSNLWFAAEKAEPVPYEVQLLLVVEICCMWA